MGEADVAVSVSAALSTDICKAADIAGQLNAWFIENAAKMRTQDSWCSPSAYLETTTASLKQQAESLNVCMSQVQAAFHSDLVEQASMLRPQGGANMNSGPALRPNSGSNLSEATGL